MNNSKSQIDRYAELCTDSGNTTKRYANFINANNEAAQQLIPIKKKLKQPKLSNDHRIQETCENLNKANKRQQELEFEKIKIKVLYVKRKLGNHL